jgi:D-alanyl-D-alanine carboxypeptidase
MSTSRVGSAVNLAVNSFLGFGARPAQKPPQQISRQTPAPLPAILATAAVHPPAANATVKPGAGAAFEQPVPPGAKPYLKGAGVYMPPGTANGPIVAEDRQAGEIPVQEIPVKAHTRNVPALEKSLITEPVTLDMLVAEFRRAQRMMTQRVLFLGALSEHWIREQLAKGTALDRATAIKKIRSQLAEAGLEKKEARVDLYIRCHWVAVLFSGWRADSDDSRKAANTLSFSALRLFPILLQRNRVTDTWQLIAQYAEQGKALWSRAVSEKLSAAAIDAELSRIVPARSMPIRKHRPIRLSTIEKLLARLKPEDQQKLPALVNKVLAKASQPAAA